MTKHYALSLAALFVCFLAAAGPGSKPLEFIENKGQWTAPFLYRSSSSHGEVFLENGGFTFVIGDAANQNRIHELEHRKSGGQAVLRYHAYKLLFDGGNTQPQTEGKKQQTHYYNYFLGNDEARWKSGLHPFLAVDYREVYPGIDVHVASQSENLKYDFIVAPGADPSLIRLRVEGADGLGVKNGRLQIRTSVGVVEELAPEAFQYSNGTRKKVDCRYRVKGDLVTFDLPDDYDHSVPLIIDPTVIFATFTGSSYDNFGFTATYDAAGHFYAGGIVSNTNGGTGYPTTTGAFQVAFGGGSGTDGSGFACDMAITKFNPTGNALIYSTYIGGVSNDQPHSMVVDTAGNLIIAGRTYSNNYPVSTGAFDNSFNTGADLVVTKLNATGSALIGSTYVGGSGDDGVNVNANPAIRANLLHNHGDDARSEVIIDNTGNIYVAASTQSTNFPLQNATQSSNAGGQDAVVFKLNSTLTTLLWSTYMGGSANDAAYVLALDTAQTSLYVAGGTASNNFPMPAGGFWPTYQGGTVDGFLLRFQNGPSYPVQKGTFVGQAAYDQCYGVQVDLQNSVYVMGQSAGGTFPVSPGVYSNPNSSQFIAKFDSTLATKIYSTVFGSGAVNDVNISPVAFLVDTCQNVYISGWGGALAGAAGTTTNGMPVTADAQQGTTDGQDFYFIVLSKNAVSLLYGSFLGAVNVQEHVDGGTSRFDKNGVVYQAICGGCGGQSFPTTPGSWSPTNGSINCNLTAVKIAFNLGSVDADFSVSPSNKGCPPFTVTFNNNSSNATIYDWNFGPGQGGSAAVSPTHTYTTPGTYVVRLIASNPNACRTLDTAFTTIVVDTNSVNSDFSYKVLDSCGPFRVQFTNTSAYGSTPGSPGFTKFDWIFGDNTTSTLVNPGIHIYPDSGTYIVQLIMRDSTACNSPDTVTKTIRINSFRVKAGFNAPDSVCVSSGVLFANTAQNASDVNWDFGDGQSSTSGSPVHEYAASGTYIVTQVANNPLSCNKTDTLRRQIKIKSLPVANFSHSPIIPIPNMPVQFTNLSTNSVFYIWSFGDGSGSNEKDPSHQYRRTGSYTVCLTARSADGCLDTICRTVDADVHPAVDVPTGFSPNGDGSNDILYVRGAAIERMEFKLFNRWGEMVFESNSLTKGWDGSFRGKPQDMDAYAYILDVTFINGETLRKTGNVTLLR